MLYFDVFIVGPEYEVEARLSEDKIKALIEYIAVESIGEVQWRPRDEGKVDGKVMITLNWSLKPPTFEEMQEALNGLYD